MLELGSCTDAMALGSVSAVGDVTAVSVVELCCSVAEVLKSVPAVDTVNAGSVVELCWSVTVVLGLV